MKPFAVAATLAVAVLSAVASRAEAEKPLERLPARRMAELAPILAQADLALVESHEGGAMRQVSVATLVAAPPALVREVVWDVERYPSFIRRLENRKVTHQPDGAVDEEFTVSYTVASFDATFRCRRVPGDAGEAIAVAAIDPNDDATYRYEFLPAAGAPDRTVLVQLGYTDLVHSNDYLRSIVKRAPPMEHGLALASQLVMVRAMKVRAEALARQRGLAPTSAVPSGTPPGGPGLGALLARGTVALLRSLPSGRLAELSLLERTRTPRARIEARVASPADWPRAIPTVDKARLIDRIPDGWRYQVEASLPLISWSSSWRARVSSTPSSTTIDTVSSDGDFAGTHQRWDLTTQADASTLAVLRTTTDLAASSLVLRLLLSQEPSFEPGLALALALCQLDGLTH